MVRLLLGILVSLVLLGGVGAPLSAAAEDAPVLSRVVEAGKLRVGMSGAQPPLNVRNKEGAIIGLEPDLAKLLADAMGVELEIVAKPFPQLLPALRKGEVDIVMSGVTITPERNLQTAFVGPYYVTGKSILTKSAELAGADEMADIDEADLTLATLADSTSQQFVEHFLPKAKLATTQDYDEAVGMVMAGEADALVADHHICVLTVLRNPGKGLATLLTPLTIDPIGVAVPPNDALLVNLLENYFGALEGAGALDALRQKWFEDSAWLNELP